MKGDVIKKNVLTEMTDDKVSWRTKTWYADLSEAG